MKENYLKITHAKSQTIASIGLLEPIAFTCQQFNESSFILLLIQWNY